MNESQAASYKVLVIFSDPPGQVALRLDREDKAIAKIAREFSGDVVIERLHASVIDDIRRIINESSFDIIQFSGHGSPGGIILDKSDIEDSGEPVSARRLQSLLAIAERPPLLVLVLSCFSNESLPVLSEAAPFVISAVGSADDRACIEFVRCFYERLFGGFSIQTSFDHAISFLKSKQLPVEMFRLDRRSLIRKEDSVFVESIPDPRRNSILVNLDAVAQKLGDFGIPEEELLHLVARKLTIHYWIFDVPRERCVIPIGRLLFGEFTWESAADVVHCTRLMKLRADVSPRHWEVWHKLLISYNDLASSEYRILQDPGSPDKRDLLAETVQLFQYHMRKYLEPAKLEIEALGYSDWLPNVAMVTSHCEFASGALETRRWRHVVKSLEEALTNYHDLVEGLRPPEDGS